MENHTTYGDRFTTEPITTESLKKTLAIMKEELDHKAIREAMANRLVLFMTQKLYDQIVSAFSGEALRNFMSCNMQIVEKANEHLSDSQMLCVKKKDLDRIMLLMELNPYSRFTRFQIDDLCEQIKGHPPKKRK